MALFMSALESLQKGTWRITSRPLTQNDNAYFIDCAVRVGNDVFCVKPPPLKLKYIWTVKTEKKPWKLWDHFRKLVNCDHHDDNEEIVFNHRAKDGKRKYMPISIDLDSKHFYFENEKKNHQIFLHFYR